MIEYKYKKRENKFTENGHTMFETDVLQRLKRLADLEEQIKQGKLLPMHFVVGRSEQLNCDSCVDGKNHTGTQHCHECYDFSKHRAI